MADEQTRYISEVISHCLESGHATVEPSGAAEKEWVSKVVEMSCPRRAFLAGCTPGYFNHEGQEQEALELNEPFGGGPIAYLDILEKWRADGAMGGLELGEAAKP
jgi:cyclohexanone monooxygenase